MPFPESGKPDRRANMLAQESSGGAGRDGVGQVGGVEETQVERHVEHTELRVLGGLASLAQGL